jgi:uncharacterized protein (TIGR02996 family)
MTAAAALLAAIRAAPEDDAPRLIYADWLDEHGQPERAEFIRVQCELARHESADLRQREAQLLAHYHDAFAGPLAMPGYRFRFQRGIITGFGHTGVFLEVKSRLEWSSMLRFFPHGLVMKSFISTAMSKTSECFESSYAHLRNGEYAFDPLGGPAGIRLSFGIRSYSQQGVLNGNSLAIVHGRRASQAKSLAKYTHVPIPGFASFTET